MDIFTQITIKIIKSQREIIGPMAIDLAKHVDGLTVTNPDNISISASPKIVITDLVNKYAQLFGKASIEVCKDAVREIKPPVPVDELPDILK
jgi:hypothetical protein